MNRSIVSKSLLAPISLMLACSSPPASTPPAPMTPVPIASAPVQPEPAAPAPRTCTPLPTDIVVLARADYDQSTKLVMGGAVTGKGVSADPFEIIDGRLFVLRGDCVETTIVLGTMTRDLGEEGKSPLQTRELVVEPLKEEQNFHAAALRRVKEGDHSWVIAQWVRDQRWGLTERYLMPVLVRNDRWFGSRTFQEGRDSMGPPVFYGRIKPAPAGGLLLTYEGIGETPPNIHLRAKGNKVLIDERPTPPEPPVTEADRDGRDARHAAHVCGRTGAIAFVTGKPCDDGSIPKIGPIHGNAGPSGVGGNIVDVYQRVCGPDATDVYVDAHHCP